VGPPEILRAVGSITIANTVCPVGIAQAGVAAAFGESEENFRAVLAEWELRRNTLLDELADWPIAKPAGGWSLLLDVSEMGLKSSAASELLLAKSKIAATPMIHWGSADADRYVRFVFANEPVARLKGIAERVRAALGAWTRANSRL
jgi:N-succinyldiaminopimelate aminotransferase